MSARVRQQSTAPGAASGRGASTALPPYEPPQFSLTPAAQRQLQALTQSHSLRNLYEHLDEAQAAVSTTAGEINDRVTNQETSNKKRKQWEADNGAARGEGGDDADKTLEELRKKVDGMTERMDTSMRKLVDGKHSVDYIKASVDSTAGHAKENASTQASTQARTQRQRRGGGGEDDEDEEYADFEPTDPGAGTQSQLPAIEKFRKDLETAKTRYQSHTLGQRYAENNAYRDFRRVVHDAQHHDDETAIAHWSEWFPEGDAPAPGVTTRRRAQAEDDDSDDDIAVSKASISTKCPLTLQEFKDPVTSTLCPHSFESKAILDMIEQSAQRSHNGPRPEKTVQCPVSGCSKMLTKADLHTDKILIRKIKRIQNAKLLEEEEEDDEGGPAGTQRGATIIDDDEDGADVDDIVGDRVPATQVKGEPRGTGRSNVSQGGAAAVVELGDDSSDEEAEEEEEDDEDEDTSMGGT